MNITFLIGNGFDLNLGLKTHYKDFYNVYCKGDECTTDSVQDLKDDILKKPATWADAELAFGEFSNKFKKELSKKYLNCHNNFCLALSSYLQQQESHFSQQPVPTFFLINFLKNVLGDTTKLIRIN